MKRYFNSVEGKLFMLLGALLSGFGIIAAAVHFQRRIEAQESARVERYQQTLSLLSTSVLQFERDAETKMWLALQHLKHDDLGGIPSRNTLIKRARQLGMTHFFVIDRSGRFIRSTNEAPELIPNLYVFSDEYRSMLERPETPVATPLIPPDPEIRPYKFLSIYHHTTKRFLHAGLRADFLETALTRLVASDPEILEVHILSPNGTSLGRFDRGVFRYETHRIKLPELTQSPVPNLRSQEGLRVLQWVDSSHPDCGQCKKSGDLREGRHQYLFSMLIRNDGHSIWANRERAKAWGFSSAWTCFAMLIAYALAKRFTKRLRLLNSMIEGSHRGTSSKNRIELTGMDEVSDLAGQFQGLLDRIDAHQEQALVAARGKIELEVARQVAHDLRSPLTILEILLSRGGAHGDAPELSRQAISRIQEVADALLNRKDAPPSMPQIKENWRADTSPLFPHLKLEKIISEKVVEYSNRRGIKFDYLPTDEARLILLSANAGEFSRVLSNLINNAIESYPEEETPWVGIYLDGVDPEHFMITITDRGSGMNDEVLLRMGEPGFTHGKKSGSGIGFHHAKQVIQGLGGEVRIMSQLAKGTEIRIRLPRQDRNLMGFPDFNSDLWERVFVVDDDPLVHEAWKLSLSPSTRIESFYSIKEFKLFYAKNFDALERTLILMDHEFKLEPQSRGLDLLSELGLEHQALLVTGCFDDPDLLKRSLSQRVRIFPKVLLSLPMQKTG